MPTRTLGLSFLSAFQPVFLRHEEIVRCLRLFPFMDDLPQRLDYGNRGGGLKDVASHVHTGRPFLDGAVGHGQRVQLGELQKGTLSIQLRAEGPCAVIEIGNTGGIPQEVLKNFMQDSRPLQGGTGDGRGQGLAIVKLFTLMHNGVAELESPAGAYWTTFRIKPPLQ